MALGGDAGVQQLAGSEGDVRGAPDSHRKGAVLLQAALVQRHLGAAVYGNTKAAAAGDGTAQQGDLQIGPMVLGLGGGCCWPRCKGSWLG